MTTHNIRTVLENVSGNSFVGLDTEVVVPLKGGKSNPMQNRVTKRTIGSRVQVFTNKGVNGYANMVHRRLATQLRNEAARIAAEKSAALTAAIVDGTVTEEQLTDLAGSVESFMDEAKHVGDAKDMFTLSPRKWGNRVPGTPFIEHTKAKAVSPEYYLEVIFLNAGESTYYLDGNPIDEDKIIGLEKPEKKVAANVQGGLVDQVVVRSFSIDSLIGVRIDQTDYQGNFVY